MSRFTTYLVRGDVRGMKFSARKRYSDFEWLRKHLIRSLPGVFIPPLPKKQLTGRFEDSFIESRRAGLEEFLRRCFCRHMLVIGDQPLLLTFLQATDEDAVAKVKQKADSRSVGDMWQNYQAAFSDALALPAKGLDKGNYITDRIMFLDAQVIKLRELHVSLTDVTQAMHKANTFIAGAQKQLASLCSDESSMYADARAVEQPRVELLGAFRQQHGVLEHAPAMHYDILLAAVERELDDADAMHEALTAATRLQHEVGELKTQVKNLQQSKKRVEESDDRPSMLTGLAASSGLGGIFKQKDKQTQLAELSESLEQTGADVVAAEEWYHAARTVASQEMQRCLAQNLELHKWAGSSFAQQHSETSLKLANVWNALAKAPEELDSR